MAEAGGAGRGLLFVSYDGVLGGPGRSQTLPYLRGYREAGWSVRLLSYEKAERLAEEGTVRAVAGELEAAGVRWTRLSWRRSMARDLAAGLRAVRRLVAEERPAILHARSYVPALLCDLAGRGGGARLLFDMRGFWPDERVEGGLWSSRNPLYLLWKRLERRLLRRADGVVVLARAGAEDLRAEGLLPGTTPLEVIPCGADLARFHPRPDAELPAGLAPFAGKRIWTFLGATGTWYLLDAMLDFAAAATAADPEARIAFLTEDPGGSVREGLAARKVPADRVILRRVDHAEVPAWIRPSRAGVFFIRSVRSKKASCPTKLAEFLGCGVPVVINRGIGDTEAIVGGGRAGVVVDGFGADDFAAARRGLDALGAPAAVAAACRATAEGVLDVREGGAAFARLAARIAAGAAAGAGR